VSVERRELREEESMDEERHWYLGGSPLSPMSLPWWTNVFKWRHEEAVERVEAPMLFTTRKAAEDGLHELEGAEPDNYLGLVERSGEDEVNEAYSNTPPTKIFEVDDETLLDYLRDSDFLCVTVDGRMRLREDFAEELSKRVEARGRPWWPRLFRRQ
jgi:hypothetical protein